MLQPVIGQQHAPNLVDYLGSHNIDVIEGPGSREAAMRAVTSGEHDVVVIIPDAFGQQLGDAIPARVELISDQANTQAERDARRVRTALRAYSQEIATMRLVSRGVSLLVLRPIKVDEVDVSTPSGSGKPSSSGGAVLWTTTSVSGPSTSEESTVVTT